MAIMQPFNNRIYSRVLTLLTSPFYVIFILRVWANSKALELAGFVKGASDPTGEIGQLCLYPRAPKKPTFFADGQ